MLIMIVMVVISVNESRPYVEVIVCICLVQVHIIIILSSSIWFAALLAKKAINIKNQGSYLEVIFQTYLNYLIESDLWKISLITWALWLLSYNRDKTMTCYYKMGNLAVKVLWKQPVTCSNFISSSANIYHSLNIRYWEAQLWTMPTISLTTSTTCSGRCIA